ncbi:hypothetical protein [Streptomyces sp. NPDC058279]|uniref:hypothetical protein n=1 Tax=Streptomyces sp. NPDC058279 TaxID=3346418 RepID=UPI0036EEB518
MAQRLQVIPPGVGWLRRVIGRPWNAELAQTLRPVIDALDTVIACRLWGGALDVKSLGGHPAVSRASQGTDLTASSAGCRAPVGEFSGCQPRL